MVKFFQKFGSHYAIERFGIIFLSLTIAMVMLLTSIVVAKIKYDTRSLSGMAVYTQSFAMSKTGTTGSVRGVYTNEARTKAFVLLQFSSMADMPIDASKYQMFLTGATRNMTVDELQCQPDAMFYLFGSTGYAGIYLYSAEPFPSQIMNLIIRSNAAFSTSGVAYGSSDVDATFGDYNQCRIYFNPGGSYAPTVDFLENDKWTVSSAYEEIVARPTEKVVRSALRGNLKDMLAQKLVMAEYGERLENEGLLKPAAPYEIADDTIYAISPDDKTQERLKYSTSKGVWFNADGTTFDTDSVYLYLDTAYVVPTGYNFVWEDGTVKEGYLKELTNSDLLTDWDAYFDIHAKDNAKPTFTVNSELSYTDGRVFDGTMTGDAESASNAKTKRINDELSTLQAAWSAFYTAKTEYQAVNLSNLLHIESAVADVESAYSVNDNKDGKLLTLY